MNTLLNTIKSCTICEASLPEGCRPVVTASPQSRIAIIGQAPGRRVHASGIPWDDASGKRLRDWLGVDTNSFYDTSKFAIIPMGFCFPGTGKSGDLPPRPECAPEWHGRLFEKMENMSLKLLVGNYAQRYYLGRRAEKTLTATVRNFEAYLPEYFPLPHPSPRNNIWLRRNPWFEQDILPFLALCINKL